MVARSPQWGQSAGGALIELVERALTAALGERCVVARRTPLGGGCISHTERLDTPVGAFILKTMANPPVGFFEAEVAGLDALRDAASGLVVPRVVTGSFVSGPSDPHVDVGAPSFLVLEFLPPGVGRGNLHDRMGHGLATLHRTSASRFGFSRDTFCGASRQPNDWMPSWVPFYATARLEHQVRMADAAGLLDVVARRRLDQLVSRLDTWLAEPTEGPALIHGDLWSGNLLHTPDGPALIDPAVYFGHREAELGMMTLFGGFPARVFEAYQATFPLDAGWRDRQPLYELYHLLNHLNLFGAGYYDAVMSRVARFAS